MVWSVAFGRKTMATEYGAFAIGYRSIADGYFSFAGGQISKLLVTIHYHWI
jgi:hypothetical protein